MWRPIRWPWIIWLLAALVFVVTSLTTMLLWRLQNQIQLLTISDNTMRPALSRGDAVLVRVGPVADIKPGDTISYRDVQQPGVVMTRRVMVIDNSNHQLIVKGGTVSKKTFTIRSDAVIGTVNFIAPKLGYVVQLMQSPPGLLIGIYVPALAIIWVELECLVRCYGQSDSEATARLGR